MIRRFLALVAILTGLTAFAAPAQARFSALDDVRVQLSGDPSGPCQAASLVQRVLPIDRLGRFRAQQPGMCLRPRIVILVPPVMLQADRARE